MNPDTQKTEEGTTQRRPRAESYCTHHCSVCKGHFSSLTAFDAHRRGSFEPNDRRCVDLEQYEVQEPKTAGKFGYRNGVCQLANPNERLENVLVWGEAGTLPKGVFNA